MTIAISKSSKDGKLIWEHSNHRFELSNFRSVFILVFEGILFDCVRFRET